MEAAANEIKFFLCNSNPLKQPLPGDFDEAALSVLDIVERTRRDMHS